MMVVVCVLFVDCGSCAKFCDCFLCFGGDEIFGFVLEEKCKLNEIEYHFKYAVPDVNNNCIPNYTNKLLIIPLKFNDMNTL